jgi:hypothetical protein
MPQRTVFPGGIITRGGSSAPDLIEADAQSCWLNPGDPVPVTDCNNAGILILQPDDESIVTDACGVGLFYPGERHLATEVRPAGILSTTRRCCACNRTPPCRAGGEPPRVTERVFASLFSPPAGDESFVTDD